MPAVCRPVSGRKRNKGASSSCFILMAVEATATLARLIIFPLTRHSSSSPQLKTELILSWLAVTTYKFPSARQTQAEPSEHRAEKWKSRACGDEGQSESPGRTQIVPSKAIARTTAIVIPARRNCRTVSANTRSSNPRTDREQAISAVSDAD